MLKLNCWEFKQCGRQPMGEKTSELGVCPIAMETALDETNGGKNGGRSCWAVSRALCCASTKGGQASRLNSCLHNCNFLDEVRRQEGDKFINSGAIISRLKSRQ